MVDRKVLSTDKLIVISKYHFISHIFDCQLYCTEILTIRSSVQSTTDTYKQVQTVSFIKNQSSEKETALHLCKVVSHIFTHRTASVDHTLTQIKAILFNDISKATLKLKSHSFIHSITHSVEQSPSSEDKVSQIVRKFPGFYATIKFISAFTIACQLSLSSDRPIQYTHAYRILLSSILILCSHLCLGLPSHQFNI